MGKRKLIEEAREILNGRKTMQSDELLSFCNTLVEMDQFSYATEILLLKIRKDKEQKIELAEKEKLKQYQTLAKYIYKDHSLPSELKFEIALKYLEEECKLTKTDHAETLGLAGAIYKRMWQFDRLHKNLELSKHYYYSGYLSWAKYCKLDSENQKNKKYLNDNGFTAINYAYTSQLIAINKLEEVGYIMGFTEDVSAMIIHSLEVRKELLEYLLNHEDPEDIWQNATMAECYFGIGDYDEAAKYLRNYLIKQSDKDQDLLKWQIRSTYDQFKSISYLQNYLLEWVNKNKPKFPDEILSDYVQKLDISGIAKCLNILSNPKVALENKEIPEDDISLNKPGKVGLALSGGGFRASLYHIGVLAALAENDRLKEVEVISTVSGGSILGMYYYLLLKNELESVPDGEVDYVGIVRKLEEDFLIHIQRNLRMRIFSNFGKNLKMVFTKGYSRTNRLSELYQKYLYDNIKQSKDNKVCSKMNELRIRPKEQPKFQISTDNWTRINKVPQLVINATSVNTGHNFQFTASWMGEPPGHIQPDIDVKPRLRRMYYEEAPSPYNELSIGHAVGASSCVPALFEPLPFYDLYKDDQDQKLELQLIDGGVHDNQGITSLLEQECKEMIISDASGQMSTTSVKTGNIISLFMRSDTIIQERVREVQFRDVKQREATHQLQDLDVLHLKSGLQKRPWDWIGCNDKSRDIYDQTTIDDSAKHTEFGILREAQTMISELRTDLDSFSDVEAYALMYTGYKQTLKELNIDDGTDNWSFVEIKPHLTDSDKFDKIRRVLKTGKDVPFKVFKVNKIALLSLILIGLTVTGVGVYRVYLIWPNEVISTWGTILTIAGLALFGFYFPKIADIISIKKPIKRTIIRFLLSGVLSISCSIYLLVYNWLYNRSGKLPDE